VRKPQVQFIHRLMQGAEQTGRRTLTRSTISKPGFRLYAGMTTAEERAESAIAPLPPGGTIERNNKMVHRTPPLHRTTPPLKSQNQNPRAKACFFRGIYFALQLVITSEARQPPRLALVRIPTGNHGAWVKMSMATPPPRRPPRAK
jgi:hypothetical protein